MTQPVLGERRTRSQVNLPDDLLMHLSHRSPMKDARLAHRFIAQETANTPPPDKSEEAQGQQFYQLRQKRSMSPDPEGGVHMRHSEPPPEREAKRAKKVLDAMGGNGSPASSKIGYAIRGFHARNTSDPSAGRARHSRKRSKTPVEQVKPASSIGVTALSAPDLPPMNQRARSVPLFPVSSSLPFIDFKNPPPSPQRARSRSPEKEDKKLKIDYAPIGLGAASDKTTEKMDVQEDVQPYPDNEHTSTIPHSTRTEDQTTTMSADAMPPSSTTAASPDLQCTVHGKVPTTPAPAKLIPLLGGLSPLTPIPEIPHLPKSNDATSRRECDDNHRNQNAESFESTDSVVLRSAPSNDLPRHTSRPTQSQSNLHSDHMGDVALPMHDTSSTPSTSGAGRISLAVLGRKSSNSSGSDAFSLMMQASQAKQKGLVRSGQDSWKRRADAGPAKSSSATSSEKDPSRAGRASVGMWKDEWHGVLSAKRVKARMRPREKPKVEAVPNLTIPEEAEADDAPEQGYDYRGVLQDPSPSTLPTEHPPPSFLAKTLIPELSQQSAIQGDTASSLIRNESDGQSAPLMPASIRDFLQSLVFPEEQASHVISEQSLVDTLGEMSAGATEGRIEGLVTGLGHESEPIVFSEEQSAPPSATTEMVYDQPDQPTEKMPIRSESSLNIEAASSTVPPTKTATRNNKSRLPRKKVSTTIISVGRVTRSATSKLNAREPTASRPAPRSNTPTRLRATRPHSSKSDQAKIDFPLQNDCTTDTLVPPRTPTRQSTNGRKSIGSNYTKPTTSSAAKVTKTPRSSPAKLGQSSSIPASRLSSTSSRLYAMASADSLISGASSSLSTLSNALEKLREPPPSRPNTSLGFNKVSDNSNILTGVTPDVSNPDRSNLGKDLPNLRRRSSSLTLPSSSNTATPKSQPLVQQRILMHLPLKQDPTSADANGFLGSGTKPSMRRKMFGIHGGIFNMGTRNKAPKVSRKTSLPMVVGSPVKGDKSVNESGDGGDNNPITTNDDNGAEDNSLEIVEGNIPDLTCLGTDEYLVPIAGDSPKETGNEDERNSGSWKKSSRRVSLASLALSESLTALPPKGTMGPPPTIPSRRRMTRSTSSSYASTSQTTSPDAEKKDDMSTVLSRTQTKGPSSNASLGFMKDCVVFVDVRTDDGDDAGSLFVEMLEGAGAKVLSRVGQTCSHIIFKNGLLSTMSRYRLLRDPKPFVVGIAWVVECVEQRKHVDETQFLIDLADLNIVGANKRPKSFLPKLIPRESNETNDSHVDHGHDEDGDQSMDGSNSSLTLDDLPPLERARRRKSFLVGPRP